MNALDRPKKFRETLWFLKGHEDQDAADEAARSGDLLAPDAVDLLPIEDRYLDDGNVDPGHSNTFGLHTGTTEYLTPIVAPDPGGTTLNEKALIGDLKRGRIRAIAAIGAGAVAIVAVVMMYVM
jgi:hypothetical protein